MKLIKICRWDLKSIKKKSLITSIKWFNNEKKLKLFNIVKKAVLLNKNNNLKNHT